MSRGRKPFPLLDQVPAALRGVILDFQWDLDRLYTLELPVQPIAVEDLAWHLDLPFWAVEDRPFQVTSTAVAAAPDQFRTHWDRTIASDLRFPLAGMSDRMARS